jgi:chemotaxis protein MotB
MAENQTIIIKKIKKGGHGHHGGAWKVAYADFVTAMMAFFLLMWLLNATEAENLAGLADYFAPTIGVQGEMGIGFRGGKGALSKGIGADKNTNRGIVFGGMPAGPIMKVTEEIEIATEEADSEKIKIIAGGTADVDESADAASFSEVAEAVENYVSEVVEETDIEQTMSVTVTPEGLEIQISDSQNASMFEEGTSRFEPRIMKALVMLTDILRHMPNYVAITGHTNSIPVLGRVNYGNWELSADRANATRRFLVSSGLQSEQIARVTGKSDNSPFNPRQPEAAVNNRITIVLLRKSILPSHKKSAPEGVFLDPESSQARNLMRRSDVADEAVEDGSAYIENDNYRDAIKEMEEGAEAIEDNQDGTVGIDQLNGVSGALPYAVEGVFFDLESSQARNLMRRSGIADEAVEDGSVYIENDDYRDTIQEMESGAGAIEDSENGTVGINQLNGVSGALPDAVLFKK